MNLKTICKYDLSAVQGTQDEREEESTHQMLQGGEGSYAHEGEHNDLYRAI